MSTQTITRRAAAATLTLNPDAVILPWEYACEAMLAAIAGDTHEDVDDNGEISDSVARTIADAYKSSGSVGSILAQLASTGQAPRGELSDDIAATGRQTMADNGGQWADPLGLMGTWLINHD